MLSPPSKMKSKMNQNQLEAMSVEDYEAKLDKDYKNYRKELADIIDEENNDGSYML